MELKDVKQITIPVTSDRFERFVLSPVFVDKSLFIKRVLDFNSHCLITRPRRWGKSLNIDMLKKFLELEVDIHGTPVKQNSNACYFTKESERKLKISDAMSDDQDLKNSQGNYPVIYCSFANINILEKETDKYEQAKATIIREIQSIFESKSYLHIWLQNQGQTDQQNLNRFVSIREGRPDNYDLIKSLSFLADLLQRFHGKQVFVLIDEYDKCVNSLMQEEGLTKKDNKKLCEDICSISKLITSIIHSCSKGCDSVRQIILTGIFDTLLTESDSGCNNVLVCDLNDTTFNDFFGLSEQEVQEQVVKIAFTGSVKQIQLAAIKKDLKDWYNGYKLSTIEMKNIEVYNPYSIMNYTRKAITDKAIPDQIVPTWRESGASIILSNLAEIELKDELFSKLLSLAQSQEVILSIDNEFKLIDHFKKQKWIDTEAAVAYLLFHSGYITKASQSDSYKVPNGEVLYYFSKNVVSAYLAKKTVTFALNRLQELGPCLMNAQEFESVMMSILSKLPSEGEKNEAYFNALVAAGIMSYSMFQQESSHYVSVEVSTLDPTAF
jgi:adenosyl cobinamide kinase/adenosyl cobinamide phosphate guanylyltransferase